VQVVQEYFGHEVGGQRNAFAFAFRVQDIMQCY